MRFDATISLGNILTFGSIFFLAVAFWIRQDERIKTIQKWIEIHEHEAEGREKLLIEMGKAIVELKTLIKLTRK